MKKHILLILVSITVSCKEEKKESIIIEEKPNNISETPIKEDPQTVFEYIEAGDKSHGVKTKGSIGESLLVSHVSLFSEPKTNITFIVIKLESDFDESLKENFRLVVRTFPYSEEDLREDTIKQNRDFDSWYSDLYNYSVGNNEYLFTKLGEVDGFKKVRIQLFDKTTKKFLRNSVTLEHLEVN